ncbi:MAG TPA: MBL fold metallo-hydrolase [bacterium]|jgi:cyclase
MSLGTARRIGMFMAALHETRISDRIFAWTLGGDEIATSYGTNCIGIIGTDAAVLVDPLIAPAHARLVERALREKTSVPVRFVVLTHHHSDHAMGAAYFAAQGAVLISHRMCRERMAAEHPDLIETRRNMPEVRELFADATSSLPEVTFDEGLVLYLDDQEIEVWHPAWAHTPGDAFVYLPEARVAVCGDLVFQGYHYNFEDALPDGVREGLRALRALDADAFIPGHGAVGGPELLDQQAQYLDRVAAIVAGAGSEGTADAAVIEQIAAAFPEHRLAIVIPSAVQRLRP